MTQKTDMQLRDDVVQRIDWQPRVSSRDISVKVTLGVVSLTGFVHSEVEKLAAEQAAKSVCGVNAIANDIVVCGASERPDPEIARDIERAIRLHDLVLDPSIMVIVENGNVILEGSVEWNYQRCSAEAAAHSVTGVRNIANKIHTTNGGATGRSEIPAQTHHSTCERRHRSAR